MCFVTVQRQNSNKMTTKIIQKCDHLSTKRKNRRKVSSTVLLGFWGKPNKREREGNMKEEKC